MYQGLMLKPAKFFQKLVLANEIKDGQFAITLRDSKKLMKNIKK